MTERPIEYVVDEGKKPPDLKRVMKFYGDLIADRTHTSTCRCPSCLYQLHKRKGGRFDKESFFLDWLETEVRLSLINVVEKTIFDTAYRRRNKNRLFINGKDYFKAGRGSRRELSNFIKIHFPDNDSNYRRIKLKLWRFRKSGIVQELEKEISLRELETNPISWKETTSGLRLAQRIADFIYRERPYRAEQRKIRRSIQVPVEEIVALRPWLRSNYGIEWKLGRRKDQVIYFGNGENSRGRFLHFGMTADA